jgi:hypothetical protein
MKSIFFAVAIAALGLMATPAFADCAADLKDAEMAVAKVRDVNQKKMAMTHIDLAKKAMLAKKEAECSKEVMKANDVALKN